MPKSIHAKPLIALFSMLLVVSCAEEDPVATVDPLTQSTETVQGPWVLHFIENNSGHCTASALSRHWILTAAHCVEGLEGGAIANLKLFGNATTSLYDGPAVAYLHPDYGGTSAWGTSDTDDDVALVHLLEHDFDIRSNAAIYTDELHEDDFVTVIAFGLGSNPGQSSSCDEGSLGRKRIHNYKLTTVELEKLEIDYGTSEVCGGDSGSPWHVWLDDRYMITSVTANRRPWHDADSARLSQKVSWFQQISTTAGDPLSCPTFYAEGRQYRECFESAQRAVTVAAGGQHACAVLGDGRVRCWGRGTSYQLGVPGDRALPVTAVDSHAVLVAAGGLHSCALLDDLTVVCWGSNQFGQLGTGSSASMAGTPTHVVTADGEPLDGIIRIAAGNAHTCGVRSDGTLWCWGRNTAGQLGIDSSDEESNVARRVGHYEDLVVLPGTASFVGAIDIRKFVPLTYVQWVAMGTDHTCALTSAKRAYCWGANTYGQLGIGSTVPSGEPVLVSSVANAQAITAGHTHTCVTRDGAEPRMRCWGANGSGQLGTGFTSSFESVPQSVFTGLTGDLRIGAGLAHTCVANAPDGDMRCTGSNAYGQLGRTANATTFDYTWFTQANHVSGGATFTCARTSNGAVLCAGNNARGQLGRGEGADTASANTEFVRSLHRLDGLNDAFL